MKINKKLFVCIDTITAIRRMRLYNNLQNCSQNLLQDESDLVYGPRVPKQGLRPNWNAGIMEKWNIAQDKNRVDDILK